ncbi:MAG: MFS transporter [Acidimicrobiales bacterium]
MSAPAVVPDAAFGATTRRWLDVAVASNFLAIGILLSAVPRYVKEELGGSSAAVGTATTIFFAAALLTRPVVGRAMDRIGRRPFLTWPLLVMAVLAIGMEAAHAVWAVVLVRLLQGAFGSTFYTACAVVSTDIAPPEQRATAVARLSLMIYLGFAFGPFIGEFLFDRGSQWPWLACAVLHLVAFVTSQRLPETLRERRAVDQPRPSMRSLQRVVLRPGVAQLCAGLGYSCVVAFLPSYSREIGLGSSGALFFTYACSALLVRVFSGRLADRFGYVAVAVPGLLVFGLGHFLMAIARTEWLPFPAIAMTGIGFGAVFPALTALAVDRAPDEQRGQVLGVFLSFNDLGNAIAGPAVGAIADAAGFRWGYGVPAIVASVGFVVALGLRRPPDRTLA